MTTLMRKTHRIAAALGLALPLALGSAGIAAADTSATEDRVESKRTGDCHDCEDDDEGLVIELVDDLFERGDDDCDDDRDDKDHQDDDKDHHDDKGY